MWKWILGALVLVVLLVGGGMWWGVRKITQFANGDSTATTTISGTPERVFLTLAHGDSISDWMGTGGRVRPSRHGILRKGDTLYMTSSSSRMRNDSIRVQKMNWIVGDVAPGKRLVMRLEADTMNFVAVNREYTVLQQGDSTVVFSMVTSPMVDTITKMADKKGSGGVAQLAIKMMVGALRMQNAMELKMLKAHIEGTTEDTKATAASPSAPPARP